MEVVKFIRYTNFWKQVKTAVQLYGATLTPQNMPFQILEKSNFSRYYRYNLERYLPFTSIMWGLSPGAWVRDMTVTADTWVTDLTVAAQIKGAPIRPQPTFNKQTKTMSKWKPEPFFSLRSFLSMISLKTWKLIGDGDANLCTKKYISTALESYFYMILVLA